MTRTSATTRQASTSSAATGDPQPQPPPPLPPPPPPPQDSSCASSSSASVVNVGASETGNLNAAAAAAAATGQTIVPTDNRLMSWCEQEAAAASSRFIESLIHEAVPALGAAQISNNANHASISTNSGSVSPFPNNNNNGNVPSVENSVFSDAAPEGSLPTGTNNILNNNHHNKQNSSQAAAAAKSTPTDVLLNPSLLEAACRSFMSFLRSGLEQEVHSRLRLESFRIPPENVIVRPDGSTVPTAAVGPGGHLEKRTRFSLSADQESVGTVDILEAISEAASNHSVDSSLETGEDDEEDVVGGILGDEANENLINDNLSDMVSANVSSGRGSPNVSGRGSSISRDSSTESDDNEGTAAVLAAPSGAHQQQQPGDGHGERNGLPEAARPLVVGGPILGSEPPLTLSNAISVSPAPIVSPHSHTNAAAAAAAAESATVGGLVFPSSRRHPQQQQQQHGGSGGGPAMGTAAMLRRIPVTHVNRLNNREDIEDKFGKFDVKHQVPQGDETKSILSDTWSTDVLASDCEAEQPERTTPGVRSAGLLSQRGSSSEQNPGGNTSGGLSGGPSSGALSLLDESQSDAWSTSVAASDTARFQDFDPDETTASSTTRSESLVERPDVIEDLNNSNQGQFPTASGSSTPQRDSSVQRRPEAELSERTLSVQSGGGGGGGGRGSLDESAAPNGGLTSSTGAIPKVRSRNGHVRGGGGGGGGGGLNPRKVASKNPTSSDPPHQSRTMIGAQSHHKNRSGGQLISQRSGSGSTTSNSTAPNTPSVVVVSSPSPSPGGGGLASTATDMFVTDCLSRTAPSHGGGNSNNTADVSNTTSSPAPDAAQRPQPYNNNNNKKSTDAKQSREAATRSPHEDVNSLCQVAQRKLRRVLMQMDFASLQDILQKMSPGGPVGTAAATAAAAAPGDLSEEGTTSESNRPTPNPLYRFLSLLQTEATRLENGSQVAAINDAMLIVGQLDEAAAQKLFGTVRNEFQHLLSVFAMLETNSN